MAGPDVGILLPTPPPAGWRFRPPSPQVVEVQQPAAGSDWTWPAERGHLLRLSLVHARLTSSTTAGTRRPRLRVVAPSTRVLLTIPAPTALAASGANTYEWISGSAHAYAGGTHQVMPLSDAVFPPDCTVDVVTDTLKAGDQWTVVTLTVELV